MAEDIADLQEKLLTAAAEQIAAGNITSYGLPDGTSVQMGDVLQKLDAHERLEAIKARLRNPRGITLAKLSPR